MIASLAKAFLLVAAVTHHPHHERPVHRLGPVVTVSATSYSPCSSGAITASGRHTRFGYVASNRHPLGTLLRMRRLVLGRRYYRVEDTGSAGMQLDIWQASCRAAVVFGRRTVRYQVVTR